MSAESVDIISTNIPFDDLTRPWPIAHDPDLLAGTTSATFILPEHLGLYNDAIKLIFGGIIVSSLAETPLVDGRTANASVFGFTFGGGSYNNTPTEFFIPNVHRDFLFMLGDRHAEALHGYHKRIIELANDALSVLRSPYRLDPL